MNANKRPTPIMIILAVALLACLTFSAQAGERGGVEGSTAAAGGHRQRQDGEETVIGSSSKIFVVLCVKTTCGNNPLYAPICYCCQTLTHKPCYSNQQDCWRQCPRRQLPARRLGVDSIVVD
ncbi:hypothetical protein BS78_04G084600 [Paspalum vaginatum]|nr:hypothetical protein BS78_04G084600 [Paspalum vaginatum]